MQKGMILLVVGNVQRWIVDQLQSSVLGGDLGEEHTLALITHNHWWPGVKEDVKEHIHACPQYNPHNHGHNNQVPQPHITTLFECISIDLTYG